MIAKDICRRYNESADKVEMIQILADTEECTKQDIIELLKSNGCEIPAERKRGRKKKSQKMEQMPDIVREALAEKMEKLDQRIKELEPYKKEFDKLESQYKEIADYLCEAGNG